MSDINRYYPKASDYSICSKRNGNETSLNANHCYIQGRLQGVSKELRERMINDDARLRFMVSLQEK